MLLGSSILVHVSFAIPVTLIFIYYLIGNRAYIHFTILALSFVIPELFKEQLQSIVFLQNSESLSNKISAYSGNENYIIDRASRLLTRAWYIRFQVPTFLYSMLFILVIYFYNRKKYVTDIFQERIFYFSILFLSLVNFGNTVASFGERFTLVFLAFATALIYRHFMLNERVKISIYTKIISVSAALWVIVQIRFMLEFMNAYMIIGNPFIFLFAEQEVTLMNIFK